MIPLRIFISDRGYAKLVIGVGRGKKQYDKRQSQQHGKYQDNNTLEPSFSGAGFARLNPFPAIHGIKHLKEQEVLESLLTFRLFDIPERNMADQTSQRENNVNPAFRVPGIYVFVVCHNEMKRKINNLVLSCK